MQQHKHNNIIEKVLTNLKSSEYIHILINYLQKDFFLTFLTRLSKNIMSFFSLVYIYFHDAI